MSYLVPPLYSVERLRHILQTAGVNVKKGQSHSYYLAEIRERFDRMLGVYYFDSHFVVLDVDLRSPWVRVWDPLGLWVGLLPQQIPIIKAILDIFFTPQQRKDPISVILSRMCDAPRQKGTNACGPLAFVTLCYLALGQVPGKWIDMYDEAVARNYLCGCMVLKEILPLPRRRILTAAQEDLIRAAFQAAAGKDDSIWV